jgi:hypothetical protein
MPRKHALLAFILFVFPVLGRSNLELSTLIFDDKLDLAAEIPRTSNSKLYKDIKIKYEHGSPVVTIKDSPFLRKSGSAELENGIK